MCACYQHSTRRKGTRVLPFYRAYKVNKGQNQVYMPHTFANRCAVVHNFQLAKKIVRKRKRAIFIIKLTCTRHTFSLLQAEFVNCRISKARRFYYIYFIYTYTHIYAYTSIDTVLFFFQKWIQRGLVPFLSFSFFLSVSSDYIIGFATLP